MIYLNNVELYLTHKAGNQRIAKTVFEVGEQIDVHIGAPKVQNVIVQVQGLKSGIIYKQVHQINQTSTPNQKPATEGLGLLPTLSFQSESLSCEAYTLLVANMDLQVVSATLFFVTSLTQKARILYSYPSNTINAYSHTNGVNCYSKTATGDLLLHDASFHRTQNGKSINEFIPGLRWLLSLEEPIRYVSDREMEDEKIYEDIKLVIIGGHSEYWTRKARIAFDQAVANGIHAFIMSGNTMWWHVRTPQSSDNQRMEIYRSLDADPLANSAPESATILWNKLGYPTIDSIGSDFNHGGYPLARKYPIKGYSNDYLFLTPNASHLNRLIGEKSFDLGYAVEFDGMPVKGMNDDLLIPDHDRLQSYCSNIMGFMPGYRSGFTLGTMHYYQKTIHHGGVFQIGAISAFSYPILHNPKFVDMITVAVLSLLDQKVEFFYPLRDQSRIFVPYTTPNQEISKLVQSSIE